MNQKQIEFLQQLDPDGLNGTIQSVLMDKDVEKFDFLTVMMHLLKLTIGEKQALQDENSKLSSVLKMNNLYTPENIL